MVTIARALFGLGLLAALAVAPPVTAVRGAGQLAQATAVDLELVLAVDCSSSVSQAEFELQMHGLASALRNVSVAHAIEASGDRGIAVAVVQWADNLKQRVVVPWRLVRTAEEAAILAAEIDATPRLIAGGGTAVGGVIKYALRQLERNAYEGRRRVIDISGDGRTNQGIQPQRLKDLVVAAGVTVNGLAILNEDPMVGNYYRDYVVSGTGAFVMSTTTYEDFSAAMLEKLVQEISGAPIAGLRGGASDAGEGAGPGAGGSS